MGQLVHHTYSSVNGGKHKHDEPGNQGRCHTETAEQKANGGECGQDNATEIKEGWSG
jgi:hypothetical protein